MWLEPNEELENLSADPDEDNFAFIDMLDQNGNEFKQIYKTPMGRFVCFDPGGEIPSESYLVKWKLSDV